MTAVHGEARKLGWMPDDATFGARLALIRQRMQWGNVKEAAVACGLPAESWRTWERDNVQPRRYTEICAVIADKTGCDLGWLLAGPSLRARGGTGSADTLRNRHLPESFLHEAGRVGADTPRSRSPERPPVRADRSHKPDTRRTDPRRPRILPRPAVGAA